MLYVRNSCGTVQDVPSCPGSGVCGPLLLEPVAHDRTGRNVQREAPWLSPAEVSECRFTDGFAEIYRLELEGQTGYCRPTGCFHQLTSVP